MKKTKKEIFVIAYEESNKLYKGIIDEDRAIRNIELSGWKRVNAIFTFSIFNALMEGRAYKRKMPILQTDIFLNNIFNDYGKEGLKVALKSVKEHLDYYDDKYGVKQEGIKVLYEKYSSI